jgi:putative transposase
MAEANPLWGAPRIHGELLKLGIEVSERTVSRRLPRRRQPPSQTWRAFLNNHLEQLVSMDFFTVPTATFRVLLVLVVLAHHRRPVIHFNVTERPTAAWTGQQRVEAFPEDTAPRDLLRDRDQIYGEDFHNRVHGMGISEVKIAPQSPGPSPFAERLGGSVRRECLDHVIVLGEQHLRKILASYFDYYNCASYFPTSLCSWKTELPLFGRRYYGGPMAATNARDELYRSFGFQDPPVEDPRAIGQGMLSFHLASFHGQAERSATHA